MSCSVPNCQMPPAGFQSHCFMHIKVSIKNAQTVFGSVKTTLGDKWPAFLA